MFLTTLKIAGKWSFSAAMFVWDMSMHVYIANQNIFDL